MPPSLPPLPPPPRTVSVHPSLRDSSGPPEPCADTPHFDSPHSPLSTRTHSRPTNTRTHTKTSAQHMHAHTRHTSYPFLSHTHTCEPKCRSVEYRHPWPATRPTQVEFSAKLQLPLPLCHSTATGREWWTGRPLRTAGHFKAPTPLLPVSGDATGILSSHGDSLYSFSPSLSLCVLTALWHVKYLFFFFCAFFLRFHQGVFVLVCL